MSRKAFLRQEAIVTCLRDVQECSVVDLCDRFEVSEATIRRDLTELEELGKISRIFGGARMITGLANEPPIFSRMGSSTPEKERIGKAAAALINDGDTVFISSGTTSFQGARYLTNRKGLTVISNSLPVIDLLSRNQDLEIIILGGVLRYREQSFVGPAAERMLRDFRADKVIMGVRAIHPEHGLTNDALQETQIDRQIIEITRNVIIVADHTKFGKIAPHFLAPLSSVSHLVTDSMSKEDSVSYRDQGVDLIIA